MQSEEITIWWESQTSRRAKQAMGCDLPEQFVQLATPSGGTRGKRHQR